jgi:hypothetical protein
MTTRTASGCVDVAKNGSSTLIPAAATALPGSFSITGNTLTLTFGYNGLARTYTRQQ